jgi:hypothetical protein
MTFTQETLQTMFFILASLGFIFGAVSFNAILYLKRDIEKLKKKSK